MELRLNFRVNQNLYLKDPEETDIGKRMLQHSVILINSIGFEAFTFKKLAIEIETTEATIYRYFENKHKLLLYILNWYWSYMQFSVVFKVQNLNDPKAKLKAIIILLTEDLPNPTHSSTLLDPAQLSQLVISEGTKAYHVKEVSDINKVQAFQPYKELCAVIANIVSEVDPKYKYPRSLTSTLIEASQHQKFFAVNMPRLTDVGNKKDKEYTYNFLLDLVFRALK